MQSLAWLSASCSNLQTLTVTDCSRIQIGVGLPEIVNLTSLKQLTIGPAATHPKVLSFYQFLVAGLSFFVHSFLINLTRQCLIHSVVKSED
jgi:hypothetical protein